MVSVFASSVGLDPGRLKTTNIGICCFTADQAALSSMSKDGLARNQDNMSEWSDMSTHRLLLLLLQLQ
jgi:hypothetical protein